VVKKNIQAPKENVKEIKDIGSFPSKQIDKKVINGKGH
jgi:hypothetical protein